MTIFAEKKGEKLYIQVAYLLEGEETRKREFGNLEAINDNFEKIVISMDLEKFENDKGIKHERVWDWICG